MMPNPAQDLAQLMSRNATAGSQRHTLRLEGAGLELGHAACIEYWRMRWWHVRIQCQTRLSNVGRDARPSLAMGSAPRAGKAFPEGMHLADQFLR